MLMVLFSFICSKISRQERRGAELADKPAHLHNLTTASQ